MITMLIGGLVTQFVRKQEPDLPAGHLTASMLGTGALVALGVWQLGTSPDALVLSAFVVTITPLAIADLRSHKLPNRLVVLSYAAILGALLTATTWNAHLEGVVRSLVGATVFLLFYGALYVFVGGLGGGDVKLAGVSGITVGWQGWPAIISGLLAIWLIGALLYLIATAVRRKRSTRGLPHGPSILLGTLAAVLGAS